MLAPVTHILPLATVRRQRSLPVRGKLLVRAGQKVAATDVIAEANLSPEHIVLNLAQGLGVSAKETTQYIQRTIGEEVSKGAIVASRSGVASRVIRAPSGGVVVAISNGQVLIEVQSRPFRLQAGLPGSVVQVEADRGATIEATGAWIQGVWGNGQINEGALTNLAETPDHVLSVNELSPTLRGGIILAGYCGQAEILEAAASIQVRGLVLSSIAINLLPVAVKMRYAIIVTEGFGRIPMNSAAYTLLSTNASRDTTLNAEGFDRYEGERPEIFIPLQVSRQPAVPLDIDTFTTGQRVRIVRAPFNSAVGTIIALPTGMQRFPSGLRAPAAEVELENGEKAVVPVANIEVIG